MEDVASRLEAEVATGSVVILSVQSRDYRDAVRSLSSFSAKKSASRVCYVTMNDPYENVARSIGESKGKMFFVDCVTKTIKPSNATRGVIFVSSPRAFTEISIAVKKVMKDEMADFAIFDSISALMVYEKSVAVLQFVHSLVLTCREGNMSAVFVILKEGVDGSILKDLTMFVDKIVEV